MRRTCPTVRLSALLIWLIARMSLVVTLCFLAISFSKSPFCTVYSINAAPVLVGAAVAAGSGVAGALVAGALVGDSWLVAVGSAGSSAATAAVVGIGSLAMVGRSSIGVGSALAAAVG